MNDKQILIVEDEVLIAKDIQATLKRLGYRVPITVGTGELAIKAALENEPDLILMDIHLRGPMDGVQAAAAIRSMQDTPVIYLTANSDETNLQRAKLTDPFGFLIKPFEERALHASIEMALYKYRTDKTTNERERWLATTLRSIADGVVTTDAKGKVTFLNAVAQELLGWDPAEAIGVHYSEVLSMIDEASRQAPEDAVARALSEGRSRASANPTLLVPRGGGEIHIEHSVSPIRDDRDGTLGCVIVFSNVTERRKLENELRQSQKLDAIGKLAGSIAHDFNNAITAVMGYSSLILAKIPEDQPLHKDAAHILRAAEYSSRLTRQLLAFSRKSVLNPVRLSLADSIGETRGILRRLIRENVVMEISVADGLWDVNADPGQCEQLVLNMAINARDAMPDGGTLKIELRNVSLSEEAAAAIRGARAGDFAVIRIEDTGTGMTPETMTKIFEPFFTTKDPDRGTGLGLSTCEGIVRQSGGFIAVTSRVGVGTVFEIHLPRTDVVDSIEDEAPQKTESILTGCETILLVEDEEPVRTLASRVLSELGYCVVEAENGCDALVAIEGHDGEIDLIVTDLMMPEMSGRELVERVRKTSCDAKILFMSGYTDSDISLSSLDTVGVAFLQKPFTPSVLAGRIREVLAAESAMAAV